MKWWQKRKNLRGIENEKFKDFIHSVLIFYLKRYVGVNLAGGKRSDRRTDFS